MYVQVSKEVYDAHLRIHLWKMQEAVHPCSKHFRAWKEKIQMPEMQDRKGEATDYHFPDKDFQKELTITSERKDRSDTILDFGLRPVSGLPSGL